MSKVLGERSFRFFSFVGWVIMNLIGHTARIKTVGYDRLKELMDSDEGFIMAVWHGRTFLPVYRCRGMGIWAITSLSRDGELQTRLIERLGYRTIRGSSRGGGARAGLAACKKVKEGGVLSITPDGPVGPNRRVQEGVVFIAERADCCIVPVGAGAKSGFTLGVWDKYRLPLPFSKCAVVFGEPFRLSDKLSELESSTPEEIIKNAIDAVQSEAEQLAGETT